MKYFIKYFKIVIKKRGKTIVKEFDSEIPYINTTRRKFKWSPIQPPAPAQLVYSKRVEISNTKYIILNFYSNSKFTSDGQEMPIT